MMDDTELNNFVNIYKEGCRLLEESEDRILTYQELDHLYNFIENHADKDAMRHALSSNRVCIIIPYAMFQEKRLPHDDIIDDVPVVFACPGYDGYLSMIIDEMKLTAGTTEYFNFGSVPAYTKWKLFRLTRVFELGWEKFAEAYLAPLHDRQKYIDGFRSAVPKSDLSADFDE